MSSTIQPENKPRRNSLAARYSAVRDFSDLIRRPLTAEDCVIQSMPDVSPTRWHLAHTTWFFEQFVLSPRADYQVFDEQFCYLFNSYYNAVGKQFPRPQRGLISRPGVSQVTEYRHYVDQQMVRLLDGEVDDEILRIIEIGINHEQQHQELMLTDIKHVLACNPLFPSYQNASIQRADKPAKTLEPSKWRAGVYEIGFDGSGFAFDNESPRHRVFLEEFTIASQPVTCGQFLEFIEDGGYRRPDHWLSMGWHAVQDNQWQAPLYWMQRDGGWQIFTLAGLQEIDPQQPVCHVSYFEADAFARWSGSRLPTEAEWEVACDQAEVRGNFADVLLANEQCVHPSSHDYEDAPMTKMLGDVWEWTASQYLPYPGYLAPGGALGEYNGKFMCNQFVLRGGSCATSASHIRRTYRNFFPPDARWQFSGFRLCM